MTNEFRRSLFGGALLAAGLTAGAQAQFILGYSYARAYAEEFVYGTWDGNMGPFNGPFTLTSAVSNNYQSAYAKVSGDAFQISTLASLIGNKDNGGRASAYLPISYFTVGQNANAQATWDWTQDLNNHGYLDVFDLTNNISLLFANGSTSGSQQIPLIAGDLYQVRGWSIASGTGSISCYWGLNIPTPGAAGLLGLAGLTAVRRRRSVPQNG